MPEENMEATESAAADIPEVSSEAPTEPGESYAVKVDGEEQQVSLSELQNGYQRQADYTRKTQEIAEERQRLEFRTTSPPPNRATRTALMKIRQPSG